ncbi:hypothetical protein [Nocardia sp. CDC160]|uniref:hypothetical protein n=1 Tax=Nocardia sp. CDC160 TaxID=3112166 RepID=UPI002DC041BE|nr:hypothetical protein [Nocardia sp. CDC160]MEC3919589.1 hypothetical protein [Nocardia sp. CDC160]
MKRTAIGFLAMSAIAVGAALAPAAASAQVSEQGPSAVPVVGQYPETGSAAILNTLVKCLTTGSANLGTPGSTHTGCLNS